MILGAVPALLPDTPERALSHHRTSRHYAEALTRKVAGWAMDNNYRTPLISAAIGMAAKNIELPAGAVFHSDRGSNYMSAEFSGVLERLGIRQSAGRTGTCYDNALAESFNAAVKVERVHRTVYPTREKAR